MAKQQLMTSKKYREAIAALGLNQLEAAAFMRATPRSSRNWAAQGAPTAVAMLLRVMLARGISVEEVNEILKPKRRRA